MTLSIFDLQGSWQINLYSETGDNQKMIGIIRIEAGDQPQMSGDLYQWPSQWSAPIKIGENRYPRFSRGDYQWYLYSTSFELTVDGFCFSGFALSWRDEDFREKKHFDLDCHISDNGKLKDVSFILKDTPDSLSLRLFEANLKKTSPWFRGCVLQVFDPNHDFGWTCVENCNGLPVSIVDIFRYHGIDMRLTRVRSDSVARTAIDVLREEQNIERSTTSWWIRLFIDREERASNTINAIDFFGEMPDSVFPCREGAAVFGGAHLSGNVQLQEVPLAFLRTAIHEVGHTFNLRHTKQAPKGLTLMHLTKDLMSRLPLGSFPCSALFQFTLREKKFLIHGPDPMVSPGWMPSEWGQGSTDQFMIFTQGFKIVP